MNKYNKDLERKYEKKMYESEYECVCVVCVYMCIIKDIIKLYKILSNSGRAPKSI